MLGAIIGDVVGSVHEFKQTKSTEFALLTERSSFTDDTVLTVATAHVLLRGGDYSAAYHEFGNQYPNAGYGGRFVGWLSRDDRQPYDSFGNGSAMRVSPVGWARDTIEEVLNEARLSAEVTHNHPEGIKGAQAVALAILLARQGASRAEMRSELAGRFGYDLDRTVAEIRPNYGFDVTCQGSVPEAILCFLESRDFEHAIRLAISLGGDADTQACIAGAIAEAHYREVVLEQEVLGRLPNDLRQVTEDFRKRFVSDG